MSDASETIGKYGIHAFSWGANNTDTYRENIVNASGRWLDYSGLGTINNFPQRCIYLYDNSPTMRGLVTNKAKYVAGREIAFSNPEAAAFAETLEDGEGFHKMFARAALSMELFGGFALQVLWNSELPIVGKWIFESFENVRKGYRDAPNEVGKYPQGYYVSPEWGYVVGNMPLSVNYTPEYFDAFDPKNPNHERPVYYYFTVDAPGRRFYPLPEWVAGANAILREIEIGQYELSILRRGAFPSGLIQIPRKAKDAEGKALGDYIKNALTGTENAGRILVVEADGNDVVSFTPISSVINSSEMSAWKRNAQTDILVAFRIPSPIMIGLPSGQAMFDSGAAMESAVKVYYEREILPTQNMLIREFEKFFGYAGYPTEIFIDQTEPELIRDEIATDMTALMRRVNAPNEPQATQTAPMSPEIKREFDEINRKLRNLNGRQETEAN